MVVTSDIKKIKLKVYSFTDSFKKQGEMTKMISTFKLVNMNIESDAIIIAICFVHPF